MTKHNRCENNQTQLSLGEHLCEPCANKEAHTGRTRTPTQKVKRAWNLAELALASQSPKMKQASLDATQQLTRAAIEQKAAPATQARARILKSFLPALTDRAHNVATTTRSRQYANTKLGELLLWRFEARIADNIGWSVEALVLYLMSREGIANGDMLFAGSPREEENTVSKRLNHDTYALWPSGSGQPSKLPLQVKYADKQASQYDVPSLAVVPTLRPVLDALGTNSLEPIIAMAAFESMGKAGAYQETALDFAGHCLQNALTTFAYQHTLADFSPKNDHK